MIEASVHQGHGAETVECFRHEGGECPRCDGTGRKERRCCEGCGVPSGRPSGGGEALIGLKDGRGADQPLYCGECHPEMGVGGFSGLAMLERMGA